MSNAFKRYVNTLPTVFTPEHNRVLFALLSAVAESDDNVAQAIQEAKNQLFIKTASGKYLERKANSYGVQKPPTLGLSDNEFRNLIPNLSLKPKTIRKSFYDTADVFWGESFSRANVSTLNSAPFNIVAGDYLKIKVDNGKTQTIKVMPGEVAISGAATAEEVVAILNRIVGATATIREDSLTGNKLINLRTNTPGPTGVLEILGSTIVSPVKLGFEAGNYDILDQDQRFSIYNLNANELIIEVPAIIPALRRTLKGSHHFHETSALEPAVGINQGIWKGSFLFNPSGSVSTFTLTSQKTTSVQGLVQGQVYTSLGVTSTALFTDTDGELIFEFGTSRQEGPVKYRGIPNTNTILIDPSYTFKFDHPTGALVNAISSKEPFIPNRDGSDLAIYLTSPSGARQIVQDILIGLAAAGIVVRFVILAPHYKYILDNPYIETDDAPSSEDV